MSWETFGGAAGLAAGFWKAVELAIAFYRRRQEDPVPQPTYLEPPKRSFSPSGGVEAVRAITEQRVEQARSDATHTALLERIAEALERLGPQLHERLNDIQEGVRTDLQRTRHGIRDDIQAIRIDLAPLLGVPVPRPRMPSRPGGE